MLINLDVDIGATEIDTDVSAGAATLETELTPGVVETVTRDYEKLTNKPSIEGVTLIKDKTFKQLGLEPMTPQEIDTMIFG